MKHLAYYLVATFLVVAPATIFAQQLSNPESVVYDQETGARFVTNLKTGSIQKVDTAGTITLLAGGYSPLLGIALHNGLLYAAEDRPDSLSDRVIVINKKTGTEVQTIPIPSTLQLNDIAISKGQLFVSDRKGDKIYCIGLADRSVRVLTASIKTPNGLAVDSIRRKLVVCNTVANSSLYEVDMKTGDTRLLVDTGYPHLDGLAIDKKGHYYFTSWSADWSTSRLLKYDGTTIVSVLENKEGMADIGYNARLNLIEITHLYSSRISTYAL